MPEESDKSREKKKETVMKSKWKCLGRRLEINLDINKRLGSVLNSGVRQETDSEVQRLHQDHCEVSYLPNNMEGR